MSTPTTNSVCGFLSCVNDQDFDDISSPIPQTFFNTAVTYDMGDCPLPDTGWGFTGTAPYWITWSGSTLHTFTGQAGIFSSIVSQAAANTAAQSALDSYVASAIAAGDLDCMIWTPVFLTTPARNWYQVESLSALADNTPIPSWQDDGLVGWPAETIGNPPLYRTSIGGYPAVEFTGPSKILRINQSAGGAAVTEWFTSADGVTSPGLSAYSIFACVQSVSAAGTQVIQNCRTAGGLPLVFCGNNNTLTKWSMGGVRTDAQFTQTLASTTSFSVARMDILCGLFTFSAATLELYLNGTSDAFVSPFQNAGVTSDASLGENINLIGAASTGGGSPFLGYLRGLLVLAYVPSTADRQKIESYYAWTYGLTGNLDPGHPYKNSPALPP